MRTRDEVIAEAMRRLRREPWYRGVCTDNARGSTDEGFEDAVQKVIDETIYWDADKGPVK